MFIKGLLIAGATGLISTAAVAQDDQVHSPDTSAQSPTTVNPAPTPMKSAPMPPSASGRVMPAPAATGTAADVVAIGPDEARARGLLVEQVASAPVPDTAENRAKYGGPMSMSGKRTAAKGN